MNISIHLLTDHKEDLLAGKNIEDLIEDIDVEAVKAYEGLKEEANMSLNNHVRTYLAGCEEMHFWGIFHGGKDKQLINIINKNTKDGLEQGYKVSSFLACKFDELEAVSTKEKIQSSWKNEKSKTPKGFFMSLSQVLIRNEGVGIDSK